MLKYILIGVQGLAVIGGVSLGVWAKSLTAAAPGDSHDATAPHTAEEAHAESGKAAKAEKKAAHGAKEKDAHAGKAHAASGDASKEEASQNGYMKFSRQFVVPVIGSAGVRSLVVMDINVEVPAALTESIYTREPKLRDTLLSTLLRLSNEGVFDEGLLDAQTQATIRAELLGSARAVIGENALNILILNITRQDV